MIRNLQVMIIHQFFIHLFVEERVQVRAKGIIWLCVITALISS